MCFAVCNAPATYSFSQGEALVCFTDNPKGATFTFYPISKHLATSSGKVKVVLQKEMTKYNTHTSVLY